MSNTVAMCDRSHSAHRRQRPIAALYSRLIFNAAVSMPIYRPDAVIRRHSPYLCTDKSYPPNHQRENMKYLKPRRGPVALYGIEGPFDFGDPVHENLALAAIYQKRYELGVSDADFNALWGDVRLNEFLRGVFWNDDPEVLMFSQDITDDADFSTGITWKSHFDDAEDATSNDKKNLTGRSHFWDMQFLHGMACVSGEPAATTQQRALMWGEFMYKVSIGQPVNGQNTTTLSTPDAVAGTTLGNVKIPAASTPADASLTVAGYFGSDTLPTSGQTIKTLLTEGDTFRSLDIGKRAIGSVMHLIQDSFARGHTRRVLLNPEDVMRQDQNSITFDSGTYGNWGNVITFHTYKGQPAGEHSQFDEYSGMDPTNLTTFNQLVGGRNAIDYCAQLLDYYHSRTLYENGPRHLLETIFALDAKATPADTNVNRIPLPLFNTGVGAVGTQDSHYSLISGSGGAGPAYIVNRNSAWAAPGEAAQWIAPHADTSGDKTTFTYRTTVDLTEFNPNMALISGRCAADDALLSIAVNGRVVTYAFGADVQTVGGSTVTTPVAGPSYGHLAPFSINQYGLFKKGINTIDFQVKNNGGPTGLVVIFDSAVAVPA